jgi:hypothetical protein
MKAHGTVVALGAAIALLAAGCGGGGSGGGGSGGGGSGGGGSGGAGRTGAFIDDPVEGLHYSGGSHSGQTDTNGTFSYESTAEFITFSVGDVSIGTGHVHPTMTPVDLVKDEDPAAVDETNEHIANIARFLQTIDDDGDSSNGILITQAVHDAAMGRSAEFDQATAAFESDTNVLNLVADLTLATTAGPRDLVSLAEAQDRLRQTLLAELAGCYSGTYRGTFNDQTKVGTFALTVDTNGAVTGTFDSLGYGSDSWSGEIGSGGAFVLTIYLAFTNVPYTLNGTVSNDIVSGAWHGGFADSGTMTGRVGCSGG